MAGRVVLRKRLRMTLDFEVEVEELTEEALREYYGRSADSREALADVETWENLCRQIRLQRALLGDEEVLRRYVTYVTTVEVDGSDESRLAEVFGVGGAHPEEDIFRPLLTKLSEEDTEFFRREIEARELFESMEALSASFKARMKGAVLEEVRVVGEGAPSTEGV